MAEITNHNIVNDVIRGDGYYGSDPRVIKIVALGDSKWGFVYEDDRDPDRFADAEVVWEAESPVIDYMAGRNPF